MKHKPKLLQFGDELPRQLLVEGNDDFHALCNLFIRHGLPDVFGIKEKKGYIGVLDTLNEELKRANLQALGIIVDADEDLQARWQALRNRLIEFGYTDIPSQPCTNGTIIPSPDFPTVGIWIMPNNQVPGILENFIAFLIPNRDSNPAWQYALQCVEAIPAGCQAFPEVRRPKAQLHTWLAWQEEPGKPIGQAISARYFEAKTDAADVFINWLKRLFQL